jgi:hypothetical protein
VLSVVRASVDTYNHVAKILTKGQEHAMIKQIEIHGQRFELFRCWAHLVKHPAIDRRLWTKEKDVALAVTEKV